MRYGIGINAVYALAKRRQKKPDRYIPTIGVRPLTGVGSGAPLKQLVGDGQETVPQCLRNRDREHDRAHAQGDLVRIADRSEETSIIKSGAALKEAQ